MTANTLTAFVRLSRPHFLVGGSVMVLLGVAATELRSVFALIVSLVLVAASQVTAHYVNEYADYEADLAVVNRTGFSGGSGALLSGALDRAAALKAAYVSTAITFVAAGLLALHAPLAALVGLATLAVSWAYSMPPVRLLRTGLGEIATAITVAALVPLVGALAQVDTVPKELWLTMAVLLPLQFAMLLTFELPDLETDAAVGKKVLGVRLGRERTVLYIEVMALAVTVSVFLLDQYGAGLGMVLSWWLILCIDRNQHRTNSALAVAAYFAASVGLLVQLAFT